MALAAWSSATPFSRVAPCSCTWAGSTSASSGTWKAELDFQKRAFAEDEFRRVAFAKELRDDVAAMTERICIVMLRPSPSKQNHSLPKMTVPCYLCDLGATLGRIVSQAQTRLVAAALVAVSQAATS